MRQFYLLLPLFALCLRLSGQSTSPDFNTAYAQQLQAALSGEGSAGAYKGLSAAVFVPGQGQWIGTYGSADGSQPVTPDMRFCIASNTKAFTAALCLKLQDEGLLSLDDSVGQWLPPFPNVSPSIRIRQLLNHQSGLFDFYNDATNATLDEFDNNPDSLWSPADVLSTIGAPFFPPGEGYIYSNTNFLVAAMCCAAAADTSIGYLFQNRIFDAIGLPKTVYASEGAPVFDQPWAMLLSSSNAPLLDPTQAIGFNSFIQAAGGIWSTPADLVRWYPTLFAGNFLSESARAELRTTEPWSSYALGLRVQNRFGATLRYHGGAWGYRSFLCYDEKTGITVALLSNLQGKSVTAVGEALLETALNALPVKPADLRLVELVSPKNGVICGPIDSVRLVVGNVGTLPIGQMSALYRYDNAAPSSVTIPLSPALQPGQTRLVGFPAGFVLTGQHRCDVGIVLQNSPSSTPEYTFDNRKTAFFNLQNNGGQALGFLEDFSAEGVLPTGWISHQPENVLDWGRSPFAGDGGALCRNNFNDGNLNVAYLLDLPLLAPGTTGELRIQFDYAYAPYPGFAEDTLELQLSADCGQTFGTLWKKGGTELATAPATTSSYLPADGDWASETLDYAAISPNNLALRFRVLNRFGNNIWLDNVRVDGIVATQEAAALHHELRPNPLRHEALLTLSQPVEDAQLLLSDLSGRIVLAQNGLSGTQIRVQRQNLPAGAYFYQLRENGLTLAVGKMLVVD
jgi:D-alanyl-D-alanine carboxypeptidase